ncbi:hypothetical protein L7F22_042910 [Adiantum nelumboides]|nr:hypothetical protein [Adiantum nelumboides]
MHFLCCISNKRHKKAADKHHQKMDLKEGDWVLLKFEKARLMKEKGKRAIFSEVVILRPFQINQQINEISFRLRLSEMWTIYDAFHIPNHVAIKISLELKKLLIDNSLFDVSQSDLEANLFKLMERRGYGEEYINRYKMMTRFHHQRVPLVILVCGTACVGKSTVATQLAQRLNLPNVLQTDMVYELIRTSTDAPLPAEPFWEREFQSQEDLVTEFARECRILRKGLNGDLKKAMKDGKPIIIEGIHLDPSIYLLDEDCNGNKAPHRTSSMSLASESKTYSNDCQETSALLSEQNGRPRNMDQDATNFETDKTKKESDGNPCSKEVSPTCEEQSEVIPEKMFNGELKSVSHTTAEESGGDPSSVKQLKKAARKAIIVPIVLRMDEFDHKTLLEEWIMCKSATALLDEGKKEALINRLMTIQDYLCSFKRQGIIVRSVSATTFPQTLDALHSHLLQCIEECQSREGSGKEEK